MRGAWNSKASMGGGHSPSSFGSVYITYESSREHNWFKVKMINLSSGTKTGGYV
jgi:hypothetical protein